MIVLILIALAAPVVRHDCLLVEPGYHTATTNVVVTILKLLLVPL